VVTSLPKSWVNVRLVWTPTDSELAQRSQGRFRRLHRVLASLPMKNDDIIAHFFFELGRNLMLFILLRKSLRCIETGL
jgi:hypothetical protein